MPLGTTLAHGVLQIITVSLGSPLGREVAPCEISAMLASGLARYAGLGTEQRRVLVTCAAGAGLAAVYNVPLGGAVFALEGLLATFSWQATLIALAILGHRGCGGLAGHGHGAIGPVDIDRACSPGPFWPGPSSAWPRAAGGCSCRPFSIFSLIGCLVIAYPLLLGNGKGPRVAGLRWRAHPGRGRHPALPESADRR